MKRFTFPLDRLLRLRRQETEQSKLHLARVVKRQTEADQQVREATEVLAEHVSRTVASKVLSAADFALRRQHVKFLQTQAEQAEQAAAEAAEAVALGRQQLQVHRQKELILEKLRERRLDSYKVEVAREEQNILDEISSAGRQPLRTIDPREGDA